jgi:hypothetical protein
MIISIKKTPKLGGFGTSREHPFGGLREYDQACITGFII